MTFKLPPVIKDTVKNRPVVVASSLIGLAVVGALSLSGTSLTAQISDRDAAAIRQHAEAIIAILDEGADTTTTGATTTTTSAATTTTRRTTTTAAATTTTTAPPTTTSPPTTTIPDTIISPTGSRFAYPFTVIQAQVNIWWSAPYLFILPYQPGYGWGIGDRISYTCSYGHLIEGGTKVGGDVEGGLPIGRFAVSVLPESSGYMLINGAGQGNRFFDGTENTGTANQLYPNRFCFDLDGIFVGSYAPSDGEAQTPLIIFRNSDGDVVEIRDYRNTAVGVPGVHFQLTDDDGSDGTVSVVAFGPDNIPGAVVYYSGLNGGTVEAFLP